MHENVHYNACFMGSGGGPPGGECAAYGAEGNCLEFNVDNTSRCTSDECISDLINYIIDGIGQCGANCGGGDGLYTQASCMAGWCDALGTIAEAAPPGLAGDAAAVYAANCIGIAL